MSAFPETPTLTTSASVSLPSEQPHWLDTLKFNTDGLIPAIAQDHQTGQILMMAWMNAEALSLTVQTKTAVYFSRSRGKLWHKGETSGHTQQVHDIYLDCDADVLVLSVTQEGGIACHTGRQSCFYHRLDLSGEQPNWQAIAPVIKDPNEIYGTKTTPDDKTQLENIENQTELSTAAVNHTDNDSGSNTSSAKTNHFDKDRFNKDNLDSRTSAILRQLDEVLAERKLADADSSYVASLYHKGLNKILEKVGEEAVESIIAAKDLAKLQSSLPLSTDTHTSAFENTENAKNSKLNDAQYELIYEVADVWFHTLVTLAWFNIGSDKILTELARRFGLSGLEEKASRDK